MEINKTQFKAYVKVQTAGRFNMLDPSARVATGLRPEVFNYIMDHYAELDKKYPDVTKGT